MKVGAEEIGFWRDKKGILYLCISQHDIEKELKEIDKNLVEKDEVVVDMYRCLYEPSSSIPKKEFQEIGKTNEVIERDYVSKDEIRNEITELKEKMKNLSYSAPRGNYIEIDSKIRILEKLLGDKIQ